VIMVILEAESVLVCTANRGVIRGMPILAGRPDKIIEFE